MDCNAKAITRVVERYLVAVARFCFFDFGIQFFVGSLLFAAPSLSADTLRLLRD